LPSAFALSKRYSALTPVFFRRAVLAKYLAEPERYEVGATTCSAPAFGACAWTMTILST